MADRTPAERPSFAIARELVFSESPKPRVETVTISDALGRTLAGAITASESYPRFNASAMDGCAFAAAAVADASPGCPVRLRVAADIKAGGASPKFQPHTCYSISTGARLPDFCDTVLQKERMRVIGTGDACYLELDEPVRAGLNVRYRGEDTEAGDAVLTAGTVITAPMIGALICYGIEHIEVIARPRITIAPTGDELFGDSVSGVPDSNGPMLTALAAGRGINARLLPPLADKSNLMLAALRSELASHPTDILITTGGVSVGNHDHVRSAVEKLGGLAHFHGVQMRPGKPVLFATLENGTLFFGLPGNPNSAFLAFRFFVEAALDAITGRPFERGSPLAEALPARPGTTMLTPDSEKRREGGSEVRSLIGARNQSIRSLLYADRWIATEVNARGVATSTAFPARSHP
ncbi:MAG: molybdopterin molybdotransferase MoeA [Bradyrhizobium sp.]|nr:molybdopterin molybdotransferase MoeA [Bradyrhizobium sp.]